MGHTKVVRAPRLGHAIGLLLLSHWCRLRDVHTEQGGCSVTHSLLRFRFPLVPHILALTPKTIFTFCAFSAGFRRAQGNQEVGRRSS